MKLQTKILLGVVAVIVSIAAADAYLGYREIDSDVRAELDREARIVHALLLTAWRVNHEQFVASNLPVTENTVRFLPAYALSRIASGASDWALYGMRFNNVSDHPRNRVNQADKHESAAMEWFRANPGVKERIVEINDSGGDVYHFTAPIQIEQSCLSCHGARQAAPLAIQENYANAYDYKEGDLRGVMSIKLPMHGLRTQAEEKWLERFSLRAAGYAGLLILLVLLLRL